ncbi:MAG TPA: phage holin family protein [Thermoanaerobaculia bacterium]|jgi:putative membrane protein|nr:phage holin family protein [Thermoanaerobaculia bacterium]
MRFVLRLLINAAALWVATRIVPGVTHSGSEASLFAVALVFGLLNALLRPLLTVLSCPLLILTLGLFTLVINAVILLLTSGLSGSLGIGFHVDGFWAAFLGALVVSIVSILLSIFVRDVSDVAPR